MDKASEAPQVGNIILIKSIHADSRRYLSSQAIPQFSDSMPELTVFELLNHLELRQTFEEKLSAQNTAGQERAETQMTSS